MTGSAVQEILFQARTLEWVAIPSPGDLPGPGIKLASPALADGFFTTEPPGKPQVYLVLHFSHFVIFFFGDFTI